MQPTNTPPAEQAAVEYVVGFLFSGDRQQVILIRKSKPAWQAGLLNGIGGKVESGETPAQAMSREFLEEAGIMVYGWRHYGQMRGNGWMVHLFETSDQTCFESAATTTDEEIIPIHLSNLRNVKTISNLPWLIEMALDESDGKPFVADICYDGISSTSALQKRVEELERDLCQIDPERLREQRDEARSTIAALTEEKAQLRAIFPQVLESLGVKGCSPDCTVEFMQNIPLEVRLNVGWLKERISTLERERDTHKAAYDDEAFAFEGLCKHIDASFLHLNPHRHSVVELVDSAAGKIKDLEQERDGLRARLSSGICSAHQTPDPLNCRICDQVSVLTGNNVERQDKIQSLSEHLTAMRQALERVKHELGFPPHHFLRTIPSICDQALSLPTCGDSDKERLDWLESNTRHYAISPPTEFSRVWNLFHNEVSKCVTGPTLRAAIDSAKKGQSDE